MSETPEFVPSPPTAQPFVLFADDNEDILNILRLLGEGMGWAIDTAKTTREIIEKVNFHCREQGRCYDCIVTDVRFDDNQPGPRFTGITAIGEIRKRWASVPVIFYSAYLSTPMRDAIKELGGRNEVIEKMANVGRPYAGAPTDPMGVIQRVEAALKWASGRKKYEGRDRRLHDIPDGPRRREADPCCEEVTISPALEDAHHEAKVAREIDAMITQGQKSLAAWANGGDEHGKG